MSIKITIGQKFSFAFIIILLLMALTLGITIKSYNNVITNLEATNEDASKQGAAGNVRFSIAQLIMFANDYIITEKDYYRQMFKQQHKQVEDYQKKLRMFCFSSREIAIVDSIAVDVDSINTYARRIFAISKPRSSSNAAALMEIIDYKFGDAVSRKTTEIFDIVFGRIEELRIQSARSKEQMLQTIYTVFILALLVSLAFVYLSVQRIVKPIKTIVKAADEIAKGDYTQRPAVTTHDEVASLARSFSKMAGAVEKSYQELEARKRFKENIYAAVPSGLLVFGEEAKVLSVNRSFCELFNLQYQQIVGQSIDDVLQLIGISRKCRDAVTAREPFRNLECMSPRDAKEKMILNLTLFGMRNAEEEVLLVIEDITERRIAEEMIKKSEDLIRTTLYSIGDAVITTDENGIVQRLNPVAEHLTGWKESEAQGKPIEYIFNIINEETYNKVENPVKKVLREGAVVGLANHTLLISKYGREVPIADSGAPIKNETGGIVGVVLVFRDQTEEREKQKALEHSNARLKEAQRMAHIGNWELDLQKNELYWCDEIFRIFEIDPAEFGASYEAFLNLVHPDEREFVNDAYTNSVKNKTPYSIDHRLLMKDGRIKYVHEQCETYYDDQGYPIRSVGTVQNITERMKAKALIAEQAEQLNVILATTTDGFWVVDQLGKIIDVNDAYCKMSGYTRDEILSFSISDLDAKESAEETAD
ncbi:MAG: PAS domain S-box protein, partial [Ignavibacteriales bacterium]|nr:PAS domain S-box protein [Ignavibacteriales bacterium]